MYNTLWNVFFFIFFPFLLLCTGIKLFFVGFHWASHSGWIEEKKRKSSLHRSGKRHVGSDYNDFHPGEFSSFMLSIFFNYRRLKRGKKWVVGWAHDKVVLITRLFLSFRSLSNRINREPTAEFLLLLQRRTFLCCWWSFVNSRVATMHVAHTKVVEQ